MRSARVALLLGLLFFVVGAGQRPPGLGDVTDIRVWDHPTHTRVVIELSRRATYDTGAVGSPPRFFVDIDRTWIEKPLRSPQHEQKNAALRRVRGGQNTLNRARIVLDLDAADRSHRAFHLENPFRIVVDVFTDEPDVALPPPSRRAFDGRPVKRIAIDPGHGGKDPGALGRGKLREKDVVLRVSRELEKLLDSQGYDAFLTRSKDVYLTLEQRTEIANRREADLFVSIHANASRDRSANGVETYLLDVRYDKQTARVAARENGTTVGQLGELQHILASLRLGYNERFAARLADHVHDSLIKGLRSRQRRTRDLGVKRGPFLVLFMADMPAILVEVGFVSNRGEGKRLASKAFARTAARGIAGGISAYRDEHARSLVATR